LRRHGIEAVADVRSRPYSRFVPHFSKERLARLLAEEDVGYLYFGAELGGKPTGQAPAAAPGYHERVAQPLFRQGIGRLLAAAQTQRLALMCRERDPLDCHRLHLICRHLAPIGLDIRHILPNGEVEAQAATERRLLARAGAEDLPLFQNLAQTAERRALERAYDAWWQASAR
jgi:uncharacterized protein (DUF488 family)